MLGVNKKTRQQIVRTFLQRRILNVVFGLGLILTLPLLVGSPSPELISASKQTSAEAPDLTEIKKYEIKETHNPALLEIDPSGKFIEGELLVKLKEKTSWEAEREILDKYSLKIKGRDGQTRLLKVDTAKQEEVRKALSQNPSVERVGLNIIGRMYGANTPDDPYYSQQWYLAKIHAEAAWGLTKGSSSVTIAILDTGIKSDHDDLKDKIVGNYCAIEEDGNCGTEGLWDHGTGVAGVAAAITNNGKDVAGIDWNARILNVRVLADTPGGTVTTADIVYRAIDYAVDHGAKVINMSFGLVGYDSWVEESINNAIDQGVVVVAATPNDDDNDPMTPPAVPLSECFIGYPAAFEGVVAVGGLNQSDQHVLGCSSNLDPVDGEEHGEFLITAPATDIVALNKDWQPEPISGTSFAAPQVSGTAALILAINPTLTSSDIRNLLKTSSIDLGPAGWDEEFGWGRLNTFKAVSSAISPQIFIAATPNPLPNPGSSVNVDIIAVDSDSDLALLQYYIEGYGSQGWFSLIPGISPNCDETSCAADLTLNIFDKPNWEYRITAVAYDEAGHTRVFCAYNCPDNEPVIGDNNIYYLKVGDGGSSSPATQDAESTPPKLDGLSSSPGSVIINLDWRDTAGESAFHLQKSVEGGTFSDFKELSAGTTSYSDTLPSSQEGKNLTYRVRARFSDNSRSLSNEQSIDAPTSYIPPDEWPGTVELTTSCDGNDVQAHLSFAPIRESTWYHIYESYEGSSEQYVVKLRAQDFPPDQPINRDWIPREDLGGIESFSTGEYYVRVVAEIPGGVVDSGQITVPATNCSPTPPPIDPPGSGILAVTISCDGSNHAWANADWNVRGGYTGQYLFQYKKSSQSTWTNSATGSKFGTWDDVGLLTFANGNHNFRVITTDDYQVWAGPTTVNVYCEPYVPVLEVSYRCSEDGGPVADLYWDTNDAAGYYLVSYKAPDQANWLVAAATGGISLPIGDQWGPSLISGQVWGWKVEVHYDITGYADWVGPVYAQIPYYPSNCASAVKSPSNIVNYTSGPSGASRSWSNPLLAGNSDNNKARATVNASTGSTTYYLKATGFGSSIPQEAVINGIRVAVERDRNGSTATDESVKLVKNGGIVGQEKGDWSTNWRAFDAYRVYGGANDLWGTTWTAADINSSNFGVAFAGNAGLPPEGDEYLDVDHIQIMVSYTTPVPVSSPCSSFGDVNNDGGITQNDVDMISDYLAGSITFDEEELRKADVNGDTIISQVDIDIVENYLITGVATFPVCEDPDNDGLPNYLDTDDDGDGVIDIRTPPAVSLTVNPTIVTAGEPFTITVTGTSAAGLAFVWWFGQNTGITDATVASTYPSEPTSPSEACADVVNPTKLDRPFCSPLFDAQQAVTSYSFTSSVVINQPGTYHFGANARDVLYPTPGEAHQASEGAGIQVVEVQNQPPTLAASGSQTVPEGQLLSMTVSATDPDNNPLTYNATDLPQGASFNEQAFSWIPSYQQAGTYEVIFTVSDGSLTDSKTTTITVLNDEDRDGFTDERELFLGTDHLDACSDDINDAAWPFDMNNDTWANIQDIMHYVSNQALGTKEGDPNYDRRLDLNTDGVINILDIMQYITAGVFGTQCSNPPPEPPCDSFGDVDDNGSVSQDDVDLITAYIGGDTLTTEQNRRADVNGDREVTQSDVEVIENYITTVIPTFPVCQDTDYDGLPNYLDEDDDNDGFVDEVELYLGTDLYDACPDDQNDAAWPLDMNNDGLINLVGDVFVYGGNIGATESNSNWDEVKRLDLNADGVISVTGDVLLFRGKIGQTCQ